MLAMIAFVYIFEWASVLFLCEDFKGSKGYKGSVMFRLFRSFVQSLLHACVVRASLASQLYAEVASWRSHLCG